MSDSDEEFGVGPARPVSRRRRWSEAERLRIVAEIRAYAEETNRLNRERRATARAPRPDCRSRLKRGRISAKTGAGASPTTEHQMEVFP